MEAAPSRTEDRGHDWESEGYVTRSTGPASEYEDGMRRDATEGKPKFGLMLPEGVPYEEQLLTRVAGLYTRGGKLYGDRNWESSATQESLDHHREAFLRHAMKLFLGVQDGEDHAAAVVWNVNAIELTRRNLRMKQEAAGGQEATAGSTALPVEEGPAASGISEDAPRFRSGSLVTDMNDTMWEFNGVSWRFIQYKNLALVRSADSWTFREICERRGPVRTLGGRLLTAGDDGSPQWA